MVGRAKSWVTRQMKNAGHFTEREGGLWGKRPQVIPVENAEHFEFLRAQYVPDHGWQGAAVWSA